jgi:hypothetical protein
MKKIIYTTAGLKFKEKKEEAAFGTTSSKL